MALPILGTTHITLVSTEDAAQTQYNGMPDIARLLCDGKTNIIRMAGAN
jgi:hypothetical protein